MALIGKVLWWDTRDGNGIIVDSYGNEFYFDSSVIEKSQKLPKKGQYVSFEMNPAIRKPICAYRIRLASTNKSSSLKREFSKRYLEATT